MAEDGNDMLDAVEEKGKNTFAVLGNLVDRLKSRNSRNRLLAGFMMLSIGWLASDGRFLNYMRPMLKTSCFNANDYPLGKWKYTTILREGNLDYFLYNYMILDTEKSGHIPSDHSLVGQIQVLSEFKRNKPLHTTYRDDRDYCAVAAYDLENDGCSMKGQAHGYHGCPNTFPNITNEKPTQRTKSEFTWTGYQPYVWEVWNKKQWLK